MQAILIESAVRRWKEQHQISQSRRLVDIYVFDREGVQYKIFNNCYHRVESDSCSTWSSEPTKLHKNDITSIVAKWGKDTMMWVSVDELMNAVAQDDARCNLAAIATSAVHVADDHESTDEQKCSGKVLACVTATLLKNETLSSDGGELTLDDVTRRIGEYVMLMVAQATAKLQSLRFT